MLFAVLMAVTVLFILPVALSATSTIISEDRKSELTNLLVQDCGSCHGLTMRGGLGPALLPESLEGRDPDDLAEIILDGRPGTPMPPWRPELSEHEVYWIVKLLQEGILQ